MKTSGEIILEFLKSREKRMLVPYDGRKRLSELLRKAAERMGERLKFVNERDRGVHIVKK